MNGERRVGEYNCQGSGPGGDTAGGCGNVAPAHGSDEPDAAHCGAGGRVVGESSCSEGAGAVGAVTSGGVPDWPEPSLIPKMGKLVKGPTAFGAAGCGSGCEVSNVPAAGGVPLPAPLPPCGQRARKCCSDWQIEHLRGLPSRPMGLPWRRCPPQPPSPPALP